MDLGSIEERVRAIASKVTEEHNIELVHVEVLGGRPSTVVRIFIDKPAGITHEDCSEISLNVGTILDVEDFIPSSYTLEVSSPGLERELHKLSEYDRFSGQLARIKTRQKIGNQQTFRGRLKGVEGETVLFEDRTAGNINIPFDLISKAKLEVDVEEEFRRAKERGAASSADQD